MLGAVLAPNFELYEPPSPPEESCKHDTGHSKAWINRKRTWISGIVEDLEFPDGSACTAKPTAGLTAGEA